MQQETKFAIFNFEASDRVLVEEIGKYLDKQAPSIYHFFELPFSDKVTINIIPTRIEFEKRFIHDHAWADDNFILPHWSIGYVANNQITYLSLADYKHTSHAYKKQDYPLALEYFKKTLVHEFVHFVNKLFEKHRNCSPTIKYLLEGIATYLSGQKDGEKIDFNFSLQQLLATDMKESCYAGWYLITKYLVENYEKSFVFSLFESNRKAKEFLVNELYNKAKQYYDNRKK